MMPSTHVKYRNKSYHQQNGLCIYCEKPMWLKDSHAFAKQQSISLKQAKKFQCTAEHLIARQDDGKDTADNIVAACHFCNQLRHKRRKVLDPIAFKKFVIKRVVKERWNCDIPSCRLTVSAQKQTIQAVSH